MSKTLLALEQDVLQGYRPRMLGVGTISTTLTGNTNGFVDVNRQEPEGEWDRIDAWVKFTSGSASGTVRRVTGYSGPNVSAILYNQSITSAPTTGDAYFLSKTFHPDEVRAGINAALRDNFPDRRVQTVATIAEVAPTTGNPTYRYAVPSNAANTVTRLIRVQRSVGTTNSPLPWETLVEGPQYELLSDPTDGTVIFVAKYPPVDGQLVRFVGEGPASDLVADSDTTSEPPHLTILGARLFLALQEGDQTAIATWNSQFAAAKEAYFKTSPEIRTLGHPIIGIGTGVPENIPR